MDEQEPVEVHMREALREAPPATVRFYEGLEMLAQKPGMAANFGWCLAQLAGAPDYEAQFRGMIEFLMAYEHAGLENSLDAIEEESGIPVILAADGMRTREGRVVGLLAASERRVGHFTGVACGEIDSAGEQFMVVDLNIDNPGIAIITELQR
jgi:hypothetical protein